MILDILKSIIYGIVEGITEWLPISSTGHMILLDEFVKLDVTEEFWEMFLVVIQLGAILAVVLLFWNKIFPFDLNKKPHVKKDVFTLWFKILVACIPAAVIGLAFDDVFDALFYNPWCVAIALIVFGIAFIIIENRNKNLNPHITELGQITYKTALMIGIFQLIAAVFPGTSRSGSTIIGGILAGTSRTVAAEFTFFLAIPVMFGASFIKLLKFGLDFTDTELVILLVGMVSAFLVSIFVIKFLLSYIRRHDFKVFGWYRIALAVILIVLVLTGILQNGIVTA